jgi:hypothetical protein
MLFKDLKRQLRRDREMIAVTLAIPADVLADLERVSDAGVYTWERLRKTLES